jgi:protein SCO1/2
MRRYLHFCIAIGVVLQVPLGMTWAAPHNPPGQAPVLDEALALKKSQLAIGKTLSNHRFTDMRDKTVMLDSLRGKPLVLSLVYSSCYHTCPTITRSVANAVRAGRDALGKDSFNVITIGFDTATDTPPRMRAYAREHGIGDERWQILSTDAATLKALADEIGFTFFPSPRGFDHMTQTTVIDDKGKIYRQVYGEGFAVPALVEPLKDLTLGRRASKKNWDGWINGVKLFCTVYDPASGRYKFDYSLFIGLFVGIVMLGGVAVFLVRAWREHRTPVRPA